MSPVSEGTIDTGRCKVVSVRDIVPSEFNAREQEIEPVTSEKFVELCDSIKSDGLIEPIVVRKVGTDKYEAIAGTRRLRALKHLGVHETTVILRQMEDNDIRIASLVENIHRDDLNEDEKQRALEAIYIATWDEWKPEGIENTLRRTVDKRTGKVTTYDPNTDTGKIMLARQCLRLLGTLELHGKRRPGGTNSATKSDSKAFTKIAELTDGLLNLKQRIGYGARTQDNILAGYGSGKTNQTSQDYIEDLPSITKQQFEEDERIKALDEQKKKELAKKQLQAIRKAQKQPRIRPSKQKIAEQVTEKFLKNEQKKKTADKSKQKLLESTKTKEVKERQPVVERPNLESNPVRARGTIITECTKLFKALTGMELNMETLQAGEMQAKSVEAKRTMKEIATFYIRDRELAVLQCAIIPTNQVLSTFRDLVYESIEAAKRKDDLVKP